MSMWLFAATHRRARVFSRINDSIPTVTVTARPLNQSEGFPFDALPEDLGSTHHTRLAYTKDSQQLASRLPGKSPSSSYTLTRSH